MTAKAVLIFIGIWTLIQSIGFGAMAFMGLLAHTCQMSMNETRLVHFLYVVYFRDHQCNATNWTLLLGQDIPTPPLMPDVTHVASRTNILALTYFIISILWMVTTIMLLVGSCISCMGKCGYYLMFHPWIYVTIGNVILDVVSSGYFIWDLINSMSWSLFTHHLEITNAQNLPPFTDEYLLAIPAIIMLCVAARVLVFWIINIASIPIVIAKAKKVLFGNIKEHRASIELNGRTPYEPPNPNNNNQIGYMIGSGVVGHNEQELRNDVDVSYTSRGIIDMGVNRYNDPAQQQQNSIPEYSHVPPMQNSAASRRRFEPLKGRESSVRLDESFDKKLENSTKDDAEIRKISKPENRYYFGQNKKYQRSPSDELFSDPNLYEEKRLSIERPHLISRPSRLHSNDSNKEISTKSRIDTRHSSTNPPPELRGQLPWSYFQSHDDLTGPKKTFTQLRDDEDIPPVPVPDYTLHFPRKERPRTSSVTTDDGKWNGPEARY